ncbi:hypothetical protein [Novipirellula caenicola]|uniref:Uncharacterized protein n=1 Tax=Novipirellula caenicola TaxID=1536901 RepID=A0ABP9VNC3_9BACT
MNLDHTEPFANTEWRVTSIETPAITTHAVFRPSTPPVTFGVNGQMQADLVTQFIHAIEHADIPVESCGSTDLKPSVNGFDKLVAVLGSDRHFLRGWHIDQPDFIHVIPVFTCELDPDGCFHYDRLRGHVNVFDLHREPEPFFQFQMRGGASQLCVDKWRYARLSELKSFISVLKNESGSQLLLKNRAGEILEFPAEGTGWDDVDSSVSAHFQPIEQHHNAPALPSRPNVRSASLAATR